MNTKEDSRFKLKYKKGDRINCYTLIKPNPNDSRNWIAKCDCGKIYNRQLGNYFQYKRCQNCRIESEKRPYLEAYWKTVERNAKARNIEFKITRQIIVKLLKKQRYKCALSGENIYIDTPYRTRLAGKINNASLDRIDPSKGYIQGNIQWIHKDINFIKLDYSQKDFIELCAKVTKYNVKY